jgi:hypothetical protein
VAKVQVTVNKSAAQFAVRLMVLGYSDFILKASLFVPQKSNLYPIFQLHQNPTPPHLAIYGQFLFCRIYNELLFLSKLTENRLSEVLREDKISIMKG